MQSRMLFVALAGLAQCSGQGQGPTSLTEVFQMKHDALEAKTQEYAQSMLQWKTDMDSHVTKKKEKKKPFSTLQTRGEVRELSSPAEANANVQLYAPEAIPQAALKDLKATPESQPPQVVLAAAVTPMSVNGEGAALMDSSSLLLEVRGQSNRAVAETFSRQAEEVLARRAANDEEAARLEEKARGLRQDAAELMASVPQVVADASMLAVQDESRQGLTKASELKEQAAETEQEAGRARGEALGAMEAARHEQGVVMGDIQQLRSPSPMRGM